MDIAIFYGYGFVGMTSESFKALEGLERINSPIRTFVPYEDGDKWAPATSAIGVMVQSRVDMFNPVELFNGLTDYKRKMVDSLILPQVLKALATKDRPTFMVYGY